MKILHASDLHLDSPLRGLARYEGAPVAELRGATRRALANLVDLALDERVGLVLIAGDLYDGDWRDYSTGLAFVAEMRRLREASIPVVIVRGNHDAQSQITRHLKLPDNVRELSTEAPESLVLDALGVAVHGQGFATQKVTDDLARRYPPPIAGAINVGLLHTALGGREGHETYAPTSLEVLLDKGYDYWALGHVHTREVVREAPWVVFPGNLQGRHVREVGPKGATVLTIDGARIERVEHVALDVVRWADVAVDVRAEDDEDALLDKTKAALGVALREADGRLAALRVTIAGATKAHAGLAARADRLESIVRGVGLDLGGDQLFIGEVRGRTTLPVDLDRVASGEDALGQIVRQVRDLGGSAELPAEIHDVLAELEGRLPPDLIEHPAASFLRGGDAQRELLREVEQVVLARLAGGRGAGGA